MVISNASIEQVELAPNINSVVILSQGIITIRRLDDFSLVATHPVRNVKKFCLNISREDFTGTLFASTIYM
jgi:hypothetical protein